jgi:hypothetical protein
MDQYTSQKVDLMNIDVKILNKAESARDLHGYAVWTWLIAAGNEK